jgi:ribose-phosphate pyrophosphokinase
MLFAGSANPRLAAAIAERLKVSLGVCEVQRFPDGEVSIELQESVRRRDVFIVQPTAPPVDRHLVELLAFADACRRASAERVIAVVPYFGYSRSDKRMRRRQPIGAAMVADLLESVGVAHVIMVDIHTPQTEGFFRIPVESLTAVPLLAAAVRDRLPHDAVVVSPDAGRVSSATAFANELNLPLAVMHKKRESMRTTVVTQIVGDVAGRTCLLIDDMISTGGTLAESMTALREHGADREIIIAATHGLFLENARERLASASEIFITDSVPQEWERVKVVSIAGLLAESISRV